MAYDDVKPGLYRLKELDEYEVAEDNPDIRGWEVIARNGRKIGEVEELIIDPVAMKVRYVDIGLDDDFVRQRPDYTGDNKSEYHLLLPIGGAVLDNEDDSVLIQDIDTNTLLTCPVYNGDTITRDYEDSLMKALDPTATDYADGTYYQNDYYNEERFFAPRRPDMNVPNNTPQTPGTSIRKRDV